jgi:hypothetical protein
MQRLCAIPLLAAGMWGLISPQAELGLPMLRWMSKYTFPGEVLIGICALGLAYYLFGSEREGHGKEH